MVAPKSPFSVTSASLFAGMGGFATGLKQAGIQSVWANEIDHYACKTFRLNHPETLLIEKDVQELSVEADRLTPVDILTAGFPCQSFSVAGNKKGFDDERGQLFHKISRILEEFGENRPKILLLENVPNLRTGGNGWWFETVISEVRRAGYWCNQELSAKVLNTAEVSSIPQNRSRLFIVALATNAFYANEFEFPQPCAETRQLSDFVDRSCQSKNVDYLPTDNRYYQTILRKMDKGCENSIYNLRQGRAPRENPERCPTLTANMGIGGHNVPFIKDRWGIRRLTVAECARLQGFDTYQFPEDVPRTKHYTQLGNAVSVPVVTKLGEECVRLLKDTELLCSKKEVGT